MVGREEPLVCSGCGSDEFHRDGTVAYSFGHKQRWRCNVCGKVLIGKWVKFDAQAYKRVKAEEFKQWKKDKAAYERVKKEVGSGGFRISDL